MRRLQCLTVFLEGASTRRSPVVHPQMAKKTLAVENKARNDQSVEAFLPEVLKWRLMSILHTARDALK